MEGKKWKIAGVNFAHMHMGDNLRMAFEHPNAEIVGICDEDPSKMEEARANFGLTDEHIFTDYTACLERTKPDIVILCPPTAEHALWAERVAPHGAHIILEKPFGASVEEADRIIAAVRRHKVKLAINWPLAWYPAHVTAKRLIDEGTIGNVLEVHYYDGNRGPLWHGADKVEATAEEVAREKPYSWFYKKDEGGGSLLDYLGYGVTLGTWFHGDKLPIEVVTMTDQPNGLEVDEHSVTVVRYETGLSKFETRWGTFTDPWSHQPQPKCGFVVVGTDGTVSSYDFEPSVRLQTRKNPEGVEVPVDTLSSPHRNPVEYVIDCVEHNRPITGPLSPEVSRVGQVIVDAAYASAADRERKLLSKEDWQGGFA
ncbi:MAG: Gfo/Idh/MocA family protein [Spirochaetota bacterium]